MARRSQVAEARELMYTTARLLGDYQAVVHGRVWQRIGRRLVGRETARVLSRLFR